MSVIERFHGIHMHTCAFTISQVHSGTQQHCFSGIILWLNIGNDIGFHVNMNTLDTC